MIPSVAAAAGPSPRVCLVGPLPPPAGGMANQCEQLGRLLRADGIEVEFVRTNAPYRPALAGRVPLVRACFRLIPYLVALWRAAGRADVMHVYANSGWSWHLVATPALAVARLRGIGAIVNYRGGQAASFFAAAPRRVLRELRRAEARIVPSPFLQRVFAEHGLDAAIIANVIDLRRFSSSAARVPHSAPHLVVTRNLEPIYGVSVALDAFARVRKAIPEARLTIAGVGPERAALERLAADLGVAAAVTFAGAIANADMAALYASADLMLNASRVDNMPISLLEALASGVPVVTTAAGGIPDLVVDGVTALLVPVDDAAALAGACLCVLRDPELAARLRGAGLAEVARYSWERVGPQWRQAYREVAQRRIATAAAGASGGAPA